MFPADIQNFIIVFIKRIFLSGHAHPGKNQTAAPTHQIHFTLAGPDLFNGFTGNTAVQGYKVHPIFCVKTNHVNEIFGRQRVQIPLIVNHCVIYRYGTDHGRALPTQFLPEWLRVSMTGQVHDGFRSQVHGAHDFFHFNIIILAVPADAQVHIDFCFQHAADAIGVKAGMQRVGRNDNRTVGHPFPDKFNRAVFFRRYTFHLRCDDIFSGGFHLGVILFFHFYFIPSAKNQIMFFLKYFGK